MFTWDGGHLTIALNGARALFTSRRGGVSSGPYASLNLGFLTDDDRDAVAENRRRTAALAGVPAERLLYGKQVHGTSVRLARAPREGWAADGTPPEEDGQVTALEDAAAIILVADCLPVMLAAPRGVAALHGGWRGLAGGILGEGVRALGQLGARPGEIEAAIGPGAGACCYEVGEEVLGALADAAPGAAVRVGERNADLKAAARALLEQAGVRTIHDCGLCTMCATDDDGPIFFSHRRDNGITGRQAGVVWRA